MIDESTLVRALVDEPPARDDLAMARARQQLRDAIAGEPSPGPHRRARRVAPPVRWIGAVAALVAVAFALQLVLPSGHGGPSGSAAGELYHLGRVAASRSMAIPPDGALATRFEAVTQDGYTLIGSGSYSIVVDRTVQTLLRADGSGHRSTTIHSVAFASAADDAMWRDLGSPPLPVVGTTQETFRPGEATTVNLDGLPTDPGPLLDAIESGEAGRVPGDDGDLFLTIGQFLGQGTASPDLRRGLFEVAAGIEGVSLDRTVTDPLGRSGVGLSVTRDGFVTQLIVDPSTTDLLAIQRRDPHGALDESLTYSTPRIVPANSR